MKAQLFAMFLLLCYLDSMNFNHFSCEINY